MEATNELNPLMSLISKESGVFVHHKEPDFNSLAWSTIRNLLNSYYETLTDDLAVRVFSLFMSRIPVGLNAYVNPSVVVVSNKSDNDFLHAVQKERLSWNKRLRAIFHGSARPQKFFGVRSESKYQIHPIIRQLEYHGVLIFAGKHIAPHLWPLPKQSQQTPLVGKIFGKLTVVEDLPSRRHLCRCECGKMKVINRSHLRSNRTKSCGCLAKNSVTVPLGS